MITERFSVITDKKIVSWRPQPNFVHSNLSYYRWCNENRTKKANIATLHYIIQESS